MTLSLQKNKTVPWCNAYSLNQMQQRSRRNPQKGELFNLISEAPKHQSIDFIILPLPYPFEIKHHTWRTGPT